MNSNINKNVISMDDFFLFVSIKLNLLVPLTLGKIEIILFSSMYKLHTTLQYGGKGVSRLFKA